MKYVLLNDDGFIIDMCVAPDRSIAQMYFELKGLEGDVLSEEDYKNELLLSSFESNY